MGPNPTTFRETSQRDRPCALLSHGVASEALNPSAPMATATATAAAAAPAAVPALVSPLSRRAFFALPRRAGPKSLR